MPLNGFYRATLCVSAVFACCIVPRFQTAKGVVKLLSQPGSPIILVFDQSACTQGEPLQRGCKIHGGWEKLRFSTEIAVYLRKSTR